MPDAVSTPPPHGEPRPRERARARIAEVLARPLRARILHWLERVASPRELAVELRGDSSRPMPHCHRVLGQAAGHG